MAVQDNDVCIVGALRSPIGKFMGALQNQSASELAAATLTKLLARTERSPGDIDELILGNVLSGGSGQNPARQVAMKAALPVEVSCFTVNHVCGSGLTAVMLGMQSLRLDEAEFVAVGGAESMSNAGYVLPRRSSSPLGHQVLIDTLMKDGLQDAFYDCPMGLTAENIAERWNISREEQDAFAFRSHQRASAAMAKGFFKAETFSMPVNVGKTKQLFEDDEGPRPNSSLAKLSLLKPVFKKTGSVTAGNSSTINDGAAMLLLCKYKKASELGLKPLAIIRASARVGLDPMIMGYGPYYAIKKILGKAGIAIEAIDLFEINEAFAVQSLAVQGDLNIADEKLNIHGGAIALGHPIGASGTRIVVTLVHALQQREARLGIAAICVGGGQGVALLIERFS